MKNYIGITIGPIFDMMSLVSTPAALWATSYMFSTISKKTCEELHKKNVKIISPYYDDPDNPLFNKNDGIGLFHDRIIIESKYITEDKSVTFDEINNIKTQVLKEVSSNFGFKEDELSKRVLFIATEIDVEDGENPILKGGKIMDSLELPKKVVFNEQSNPILASFTGDLTEDDAEEKKEGKNEQIKAIAKKGLKIDLDKWPLVYKKKSEKTGEENCLIKSLPAIAKSVRSSKMKKHSYYAIVRSDGDNMSKIIERLPIESGNVANNDEENKPLTLSDFSKVCLEYCADVAAMVTKYKGVPVYSSGDDLLAVMPCDSGDIGTVFNFVKDVNNLFEQKFKSFIDMIKQLNENKADKDKISVPSLSFGISICFKKFPLYEALEDSANLLFNIAKSKKNCSVIRLQKHSGQSEGLLIYNDALDDFLKIHNIVLQKDSKPIKSDNQGEDESGNSSINEILLSALYKTEKFEKLFIEADNESRITNLFKNTFDAPDHNDNNFVHKTLPEFYTAIRTKGRILSLSDDGLKETLNDIKVFNFAMRMLKFFVEKGGKEIQKDEKDI